MRYVYKKKYLIALAAVLDAIGGILFLPFKCLFRDRKRELKRILVVRLDHIGDVIMATGILEPLRSRYKGAVIDFMVSSASKAVLANDPSLSNLIVFDAPWFLRSKTSAAQKISAFLKMTDIIRRGRYDAAIDLRGDLRHITAAFLAGVKTRVSYGITGGGFLLTHNVPYEPGKHQTDKNMSLLAPLGVSADEGKVKLFFDKVDENAADQFIKDRMAGRSYAVLHMVPGHSSKTWDIGNFGEVAGYIFEKKGLIPVVVGLNGDCKSTKKLINFCPEIIDISGQTSLGMLYYLIRKSALFVGVDSAPAHLAAATGTKVIVLFSGINDPAEWAPRGDRVRVVCPGKGKDLSGVSVQEVERVI